MGHKLAWPFFFTNIHYKKLAPNKGYTVNGAYHIFAERDMTLFFLGGYTKDNLVQEGLIQQNSNLGVSGCRSMENIRRLFVGCDFFGSIWELVRQWICVHYVNLLHLTNQLLHFINLRGFFKNIRSLLQVIWPTCVWVIWKEQNYRFFRHME